MPRSSIGITENSSKRFIIEAGAIYLNYGETVGERILGATRGGATFEIEQEVKEVEIDGVKGPLVGARRITEVHARITANLLEMTSENLILAIAGATSSQVSEEGTTGTTHTSIIRTREIGSMDYLKNIALVGRMQGTEENVIFLLFNVLADGGFSMQTEDKGESVVEVQFTGHYDPANIDKEPWEMRIPNLPVTP